MWIAEKKASQLQTDSINFAMKHTYLILNDPIHYAFIKYI